jgi:hypothetical protein
VAGVPVRISLFNQSLGQEVELADMTTDAAGTVTPRFELPAWDDGQYELRVVAQPNGKSETLTRTVDCGAIGG